MKPDRTTPQQDDASRRQVMHLHAMIQDALRHAEGLAARASEATEGTQAALDFNALRAAIVEFRTSAPAVEAVRRHTYPPG